MMGKDRGMLEWLVEQCGLNYLSDLRVGVSKRDERGPLHRAVERTHPEDWTLDEWRDTIHYLTDTRKSFESREAARGFLLERLGQ